MYPLFLSIASFEHFPDEAHCIAERDSCIVPRNLWLSWIDNQEQELLLIEITQNTVKHTLVVETHHDFSRGTIYVPPRYANDFNLEELVEVNVRSRIPPIATKIKLSILEDEFEGFDLAAAASEYLSHWNILSKGAILSIPCPELGGFPVDVFVVDVEPEPLVLLRGEVNLEIESREPPASSPPSGSISQPSLQNRQSSSSSEYNSTEDDEFTSILPSQNTAQQFACCGQKRKNEFVAFSGTGYKLGS